MKLILLAAIFCAMFGGSSVTAEENGRVEVRDESGMTQTVQTLPLEGRVVGLCANVLGCWGLTDAGEIFASKNLREWEVFSFNREYENYYPEVEFIGIAAGNRSFAIAGVEKGSGLPAVYTSSGGNVWSPRELTYSVGMTLCQLSQEPLKLESDLERDEFILVCAEGVRLHMPPCSHCNVVETVSALDLSISGH